MEWNAWLEKPRSIREAARVRSGQLRARNKDCNTRETKDVLCTLALRRRSAAGIEMGTVTRLLRGTFAVR